MTYLKKLPVFAAIVIGVGACTPKTKEKIVYVEVIREVEKEKLVEVPGTSTSDTGNQNSDPAPSTSSTVVSTNLQLSGDLAVVTPGALAVGAPLRSFGLAAENVEEHTIYCTTFDDTPVACAATVLNGKFAKTCENYAGKTFGCFLRKGTQTLTTIEFGGDTSLVTGAGTLVSNITYDTASGLARAKVDEEKSTALAPDAIAEAMKNQGLSKTELPDLTGTWKTDCINSPSEGIYCNPEDDPNYSTDVDRSKKYCKHGPFNRGVYANGTSSEVSTYEYFLCAEGNTGVNVPAGYCYSQWLMPPGGTNTSTGTGGTTTAPQGGYGECTVIFPYCFDSMNPNMQSMPECIAARSAGQKDPPPTQLFLSQHEDDLKDLTRVAVWKDAQTRNACIDTTAGYTEVKPAFGLKLKKDMSSFSFFPFNLSSRSALDASIDAAVDDMAKSSDLDSQFIARKLISMGGKRESWRVEQCKNSPYSDSANPAILIDMPEGTTDISYHKCQFRLEELTSYSWEDWSTGTPKTVTNTYPTWWWDTEEFKSNTSGKWTVDANSLELSSEAVQCTFDAADGSGLPFCPPYASPAGTYTQHYKLDTNNNKVRLMLVCMVTQQSGGSQSYSFLQQSPSPSKIMSEAITTMASSSGCDSLYSGTHALAGVPKMQVESIRRVVSELALSKNFQYDREKICHGVDGGASWDFNSCSSAAYGAAGYQLCWNHYQFSSTLGLTLESAGDFSGSYKRPGRCSNAVVQTEIACAANAGTWGSCSDGSTSDQTVCDASMASWQPTSLTTDVNQWDSYFFESCALIDSTVKAKFDSYNDDVKNNSGTLADSKAALVRACRDAVASGGSKAANLSKQIDLARSLAMSWEWMPTKAIACSASAVTRNKLLDGLDASCMADASLNMFCDYSGNCMSSLRCNGSKEGGKCFKDGEFIGNIPGRLGFMDLKLRSGGAFELNELVQDRWNQWSTTENKNEICEATRNILVNSQKKSASEFIGVFKTTEKMECKVDENASDTPAVNNGGNNGGTAAGTDNNAQATNFDRAKMGDTLQKLRFRKCSGPSCSEY